MKPETKALKEKAQEIVNDAVMVRYFYLEEHCENYNIEYTKKPQKAVAREAIKVAKMMGYIKVPGLFG